jgi:hypothetical protein
LIHLDGNITWSLNEEVVKFLELNTKATFITAETGIGDSTILLTSLAKTHYCFTPDQEEINRCNKLIKNDDSFIAIRGFSQNELPTFSQKLDLALVDGGHGYPVPIIDAFYFGRLLNIGGFLLIDDIQIWTGKIIVDFLSEDPSWKKIAIHDRTAIFQKLDDYDAKEWNLQPKIISLSQRMIIQRRIQLFFKLLSRLKIKELYLRVKDLYHRAHQTRRKLKNLDES